MTEKLSLPNAQTSSLGAFFSGLKLPFSAVGYLVRRPKLWPLVLIPIMINLIVFIVLIGWGFSTFSDTLSGWLEGKDAWYWTALQWSGKLLFWAITLLSVYFIFTPTALIVAAPFNDRLAENVERSYGFAIEDKRPIWKMVIEEAFYAIKSEIKRMIVIFGILILLLPINLWPVIGSAVYTVTAFLFASWCAALEFTSYATDRRHWRLREKWRTIRDNLAPCMGFGVVSVVLLMIPLLNVLMVSVSAVGGTLLFGIIQQRQSGINRQD